MHKGTAHKKLKLKLNKKKRSMKGGMGAAEYATKVFGTFDQQMANSGPHMELKPLPVAQAGGKSRKVRKSKTMKRGGNTNYDLNPAELETPGQLSNGQKGGYFTQLLERAAVPFGLMAMQQYAKTMKKRRSKK